MNTKFKTKADADKRTIRMPVRLTADESERIRNAAAIRHLDVAEYMRRAALGRRADVRYDTEIVLKLSEVVRVLRALHGEMVANGISPPEAIWTPVMDEAMAAMIRISR